MSARLARTFLAQTLHMLLACLVFQRFYDAKFSAAWPWQNQAVLVFVQGHENDTLGAVNYLIFY